MVMAETSRLALNVLKATGLYSDEALARIVDGRAKNPEMGLVEATVKFGGAKEADFLRKTGLQMSFLLYHKSPAMQQGPKKVYNSQQTPKPARNTFQRRIICSVKIRRQIKIF